MTTNLSKATQGLNNNPSTFTEPGESVRDQEVPIVSGASGAMTSQETRNQIGPSKAQARRERKRRRRGCKNHHQNHTGAGNFVQAHEDQGVAEVQPLMRDPETVHPRNWRMNARVGNQDRRRERQLVRMLSSFSIGGPSGRSEAKLEKKALDKATAKKHRKQKKSARRREKRAAKRAQEKLAKVAVQKATDEDIPLLDLGCGLGREDAVDNKMMKSFQKLSVSNNMDIEA
ncbi:hypothetical protein BZA77DRAFT_354539 [Pyronema omphalodes]|nr:hypothetical protein BZA77DRAFT_354539 [Pyronema omphalodes]